MTMLNEPVDGVAGAGWRRWSLSGLDYSVIFLLASVVFTFSMFAIITADDMRLGGKACDAAFERFIKADNLVDLERSEFLLKQLDCGLTKRL